MAVESLYPPEMAPDVMSVDAFMAALPQLDASFAARVAAAAAAGSVLRYAAVVEAGAARVGLEAVPKDSPLGRLRGTDNLVEVSSAVYTPAPLVLQGRGAGAAATAAGVLADVLELHDSR